MEGGREGGGDHAQLVRESVMGTFASLSIPVTLARGGGLRGLPSAAEAAPLPAM